MESITKVIYEFIKCYFLTGLALNSDNIKAYYRKASALKILREYKFALISAEEGQRRAEMKDRKSDVSHNTFYTSMNK